MILRLLRSNQPIAFFLVLVITIFLWLGSLLHPTFPDPSPSAVMPLYFWISRLLTGNPLISVIAALLLVILSGYMLTRLNNKYIFIQERTQMPWLFFVLIAGAFPIFQTLNPLHVALPFILVAIDRIIGTYRVDSLSYNPFEASVFIGIATLFYGPSVFLISIVWIGLLLFRPAIWREWFFTIAGIMVPFVLWYGILLLQDKPFSQFLNNFSASLNTTVMHHFNKKETVFLAFLVFLILVSTQVMIQKFQSKKIIARRSFTMFLWIFLLLFAGYFLIPSTSLELIITAAVPMSFLFTHFFQFVNKRWWGELLIWIFFILIVALNIPQ